METIEPLSEKRRVQAEINAARARGEGTQPTRLPAVMPARRGYSAQPQGYDPDNDPWTVDNLLQGSAIIPLRDDG